MVRVKICGITNAEDAQQAVASGADALGFVFYERSPRHVTTAQVRAILLQLPPLITTVGLFVNATAVQVRSVMAACGLAVAQLHGATGATPEELVPYPCLPALSVKDEDSLSRLDQSPETTWLLDTYVKGEYGGTGRSFDWQLARKAALSHRIVLAGGLNADNVAEAVRTVRPYGVDVSSGVEVAPGRKDPQKVAAFIRAAKENSIP